MVELGLGKDFGNNLAVFFLGNEWAVRCVGRKVAEKRLLFLG